VATFVYERAQMRCFLYNCLPSGRTLYATDVGMPGGQTSAWHVRLSGIRSDGRTADAATGGSGDRVPVSAPAAMRAFYPCAACSLFTGGCQFRFPQFPGAETG